MASEELNILHIDTAKYWRGGQQQVFYLHQGLIKRHIKSLVICQEDSELQKKCRSLDLPLESMNFFGEIDFLSAFKIARICKRNNIRIVHAHSAHALSIAVLTKLFFRSLILIGVRRVDFHIRKNFFSQIKYNTKLINKIVCISAFIKSVMISDKIPEEKLITIRSGIDIHKFDSSNPDIKFRESLGINKHDFLIGTIAAFAGHKDYPTLLTAFSIVKAKIKNVKLCMVGDGPLKSSILSLATELKIVDGIVAPGYREDIGNFLKSFDLFVLASKKEGLGTSILDALSVGLPIIATEAGGIPEMIINRENGILVEAENPKALAKVIMELYAAEDTRILLSKNAIRSVENFSVEKTISHNISLYRNLLGIN